MRQEVEHACHYGKLNHASHTAPNAHEHEANLTDRGIGQNSLQVGLSQGIEASHEGRQATDGCDNRCHGVDADQERCRAGDEINTSRDHSCGVNQGRDRRRAFHRIWQPDIKWNLCRLCCSGPEEEETDSKTVEFADLSQHSEHVFVGQVVIRYDCPEPEKADCETQVADSVDEKCFFGGSGGRWFFMPEADQEIAASTNAFPEAVSQDIVVG